MRIALVMAQDMNIFSTLENEECENKSQIFLELFYCIAICSP